MLACVGCGLLASQEPSVRHRDGGMARCNDCERRRDQPIGVVVAMGVDGQVSAARPLRPHGLAGDSAERKRYPMLRGLIGYFPNACAYVSHVSLRANEQHNPGEPMHWAFDKSIGQGDEIVKHLAEAGTVDTDGLLHTGKAAWRALELLERELLEAHPELKPGRNVRNFKRGAL